MVLIEEQIEATSFDGEDNEDFATIPIDERYELHGSRSLLVPMTGHRRKQRGTLELQPGFPDEGWSGIFRRKANSLNLFFWDVPLPLIYLRSKTLTESK